MDISNDGCMDVHVEGCYVSEYTGVGGVGEENSYRELPTLIPGVWVLGSIWWVKNLSAGCSTRWTSVLHACIDTSMLVSLKQMSAKVPNCLLPLICQHHDIGHNCHPF